MFYSQFVLAIVLLSTHSVLSETFKEIADACNKENRFTGDIENMDYNDPAVPQAAKCAVACLLEKKGVFKPDGSIDREKERAIPEEIIKDEELKKKYMKAIDECDTSAKANNCETAYEFVKCLNNKALPKK
ncbi:unnamed protein product, partial [Nezara viridula]